MKNEIDKDFYCGAGAYNPEAEAGSTCPIRLSSCREECVCRHRKYPTPEQFRQEYGEEYPYDGAVYVLFETAISCNWVAALYADAKWMIIRQPNFYSNIIIACTPFGKPPDDWRPE